MARRPTPTRRGLLQAGAAGLLVSAAAGPSSAAEHELRVVAPKAAGQVNPLGVGDARVRLSWRLEAQRRGVTQSAYRVEAASSLEDLNAGRADLWDSGRVESDRTFDISYDGARLPSRTRAWWRVTVWDERGASAASPVAFWETGLLAPADWSATWVAAETRLDRDDRLAGLTWIAGPEADAGASRDFRLSFALDAPAWVDLIFTATARTQPFIDGRALPVLTPLDWLPPAVTHTVELAQGRHVLGLRLGQAVAKPAFLKGKAGCAMLVRIRYCDGRIVRVDDASARFTTNAEGDWTQAGFDDGAWTPAVRVDKTPSAFASNGGALLRRDFPINAPIAQARLYVTALGVHETRINGRPIDDAVLAPEWTHSAKRCLYRVHDVTSLLRQGENTIAAMVGDGWYGSRILATGRFSFGEAPLRYLAQLEIRYADGRLQSLGSDETWQVGRSPITYCDIYGGEDYDARLEQAGWDAPGFRAGASWTRAQAAPFGPERLEAMISPPIRRTAILGPQSITERGGAYIVDFGQNFAGWARLKVKGSAGQLVTLRFAEVLDQDGRVDQSNLRTARAADVYVLKGAAQGETYEPRFTYHGFRYVEISGLTAPPTVDDIAGVVIQSDLEETGALRIDNRLIMRMWANNLWSQRSNFTGVPTDCPQRDERMGWLGDANVFWDAGAFNMDVAGFTRRWMGDIRASQTAEGVIPEISPTTWGASGARGATPGWADAGVILPWTVWRRFGDTAIIQENWDLMTRYMAFVRRINPSLVWTQRRGSDYGDWLAFDAKQPGDPTTPKDLVATAMWKRSADAMAQMAKALGRNEEALAYAGLAADIRSAFIQAFVSPDGQIGNGSQTSYILALAFDLVPTERRAAAAARLKADIDRRGHLTTGFLGTPFSLDVLANAGYGAVIYDLLLRTAYPSWGYMAARGATTTWERWNSDVGDVSMNSFNHYALGAINGFVYRRIAGLEPLEPGFSSFRVAPILDPRVRRGGGRYDAVVGSISTDWTIEDDGVFRLKVQVPANTRALVVLPVRDQGLVTEGGRPLSALKALQTLEPDGLTVRIGSGDYDFRARRQG
ncbi:alpha-L-rhamnosidase [Caulobacter endophyticus]|uniref:alpha-L-rhamnosidase n=1 Tax=Caulobacter endophyticus TaxID=2172652 RepID=UPI00240E9FFB|nr:alpha-L-rhamnosidase [Caulobacter endophyticus]MDG2528148.1 family 78 glycoside hydrolase catalytic domain [Caulobacter endophyticus]